MRYETVSMIDILGELRREKNAQNLMRYNQCTPAAPKSLTTTIAFLEHHHCSRPHYHSISRPLQSHPAAIGRPCRQTATTHSQQYRSAAECFRLVAVPQERTAMTIYYCIPYSPGARRESHQTGSDTPAESVLPRHSVSAVPPNPEVTRWAPLSPAGPSCGSSFARRKRRYRMSARTCSTRSRSSYFG